MLPGPVAAVPKVAREVLEAAQHQSPSVAGVTPAPLPAHRSGWPVRHLQPVGTGNRWRLLPADCRLVHIAPAPKPLHGCLLPERKHRRLLSASMQISNDPLSDAPASRHTMPNHSHPRLLPAQRAAIGRQCDRNPTRAQHWGRFAGLKRFRLRSFR